MKYESQGEAASNSGKYGEYLIAKEFSNKGIIILGYKDYEKYKTFFDKKTVVVKNYHYINHFGTKARLDFAVIKNGKKILGIEVKRQNVPGSVDEKMACVAMNGCESQFDYYICAALGDHWQTPRGKKIIECVNNYTSNKNKFKAMQYKEVCGYIRRVFGEKK